MNQWLADNAWAIVTTFVGTIFWIARLEAKVMQLTSQLNDHREFQKEIRDRFERMDEKLESKFDHLFRLITEGDQRKSR